MTKSYTAWCARCGHKQITVVNENFRCQECDFGTFRLHEMPKPTNPFRTDAPLCAPSNVGPEITATDVLRRLAGLPTDAKARKAIPIFTGVLKYFPDALAAVAELSRIGNDQHNPGQPLHWDKTKSTDHLDCLVRHLLEAGTDDTDGVRHSAKVAWRALANLQTEIDKGG